MKRILILIISLILISGIQVNAQQEQTSQGYRDAPCGFAFVWDETILTDLPPWAEGYAHIFEFDMGYWLMSCGMSQVERDLIGLILGELNLGSSELADPTMSTKLGKLHLAGFLLFTTHFTDSDVITINIRTIALETGEQVYANTLFYPKSPEPDVTAEARKEALRMFDAIKKYAEERVINYYSLKHYGVDVDQLSSGYNYSWKQPVTPLLEDPSQPAEPNSVGIYSDYDGLDKKSQEITSDFALRLGALISNEGIKVMNHNLQAILEEIKQRKSGQGNEGTSGKTNLIKEALSIMVSYDFTHGILRYILENNRGTWEVEAAMGQDKDLYPNYTFKAEKETIKTMHEILNNEK